MTDGVAQDSSEVPLRLHTLPVPKKDVIGSAAEAPTDPKPDAKEPGLLPSTLAIPRLVSVVEIIKREYLKTLEISHSRSLVGLYQYNEIGFLEHEAGEPAERNRAQSIALALEGKN